MKYVLPRPDVEAAWTEGLSKLRTPYRGCEGVVRWDASDRW